MALSVSIELVSSSARVTSVKSYKRLGVSDGHPDPKIGPQVYLGPIKITLTAAPYSGLGGALAAAETFSTALIDS